MTFSEIRSTAEEAAGMIREWSDRFEIHFKPSMNITGGEPFFRKDLLDILACIKQLGFQVFLLTNGTLIDRGRARALADIGVDGVQVSMEGAGDIHDHIRGKGSFRAAAEGVRRLVDSGLDVTLNMTLSVLNLEHVNSLIAFASDGGAKRVGFSRLVPSGQGSALIDRMLTKEQLKELYTRLPGPEAKGPAVVTGDPLASGFSKPSSVVHGNVAVSGCAAGVAGLTILPDGELLPCRRLPVSIGNVRADSLREVWTSSPVLEALRNREQYGGRCGACSRWAVCRGCRAIAYAWSRTRGRNDFLGDDPQCFFHE